MANWDTTVNNRVTMGRSRSLCLALNDARRRREAEEEETRDNSIFGEGDCPSSTKIESGGKGSQGEIAILIWQEGEVGPSQCPHQIYLGDSPITSHAVKQQGSDMWLSMSVSLQESTPHPALLLIHLAPIKITVLAICHPTTPPPK